MYKSSSPFFRATNQTHSKKQYLDIFKPLGKDHECVRVRNVKNQRKRMSILVFADFSNMNCGTQCVSLGVHREVACVHGGNAVGGHGTIGPII